MHPMFVKLFIETDADELSAQEDGRRRARRSRRARPPWSSGPASVAGASAAAVTDDPSAAVVGRFQMRCNPRCHWTVAICRHQPPGGAADGRGGSAAGREGAQP